MQRYHGMSEDDFWALIESSKGDGWTKVERVRWLKNILVARSPEEIADFHMWMFLNQKRAETWELFGAAGHLFGISSDDGFQYFVGWLIGLGREAFETTIANPDSLIDLPEARERVQYRRSVGRLPEELYPEFESLCSLAIQPYEQVTGKGVLSLWETLGARGIEVREPFNSTGDYWDDPEEARWRLPRIHRYLTQGESGSASE
ncbi:DUF4240 domain-containing protein [Nonomuraea sp. B10E15]|uniref:DUF4240 domain-containing protein n=1 Tax=Nonomuraea sp. B10E15 TaxID=3153560 RepID=UPI00325DBB0C